MHMPELQVIRDTFTVTAAEAAAVNFWGRGIRPGEGVVTYIDTLAPERSKRERWLVRSLVSVIVNSNGVRKHGAIVSVEGFNDRSSGTQLLATSIQGFGELTILQDFLVDYGLLIMLRPGACIATDILSTVVSYEVVT